jgi:hypothetical protein
VTLVRSLYAIERQAKDASVTERLERRQQQSVPILNKLHEKFLAWKEQLLPKHPMAEALSYALNQWTTLKAFCSDGAVPIDNNVSEREMKRIVLNRKNSLFVGNPRGGQTAALGNSRICFPGLPPAASNDYAMSDATSLSTAPYYGRSSRSTHCRSFRTSIFVMG